MKHLKHLPKLILALIVIAILLMDIYVVLPNN